MRKHYPLNPNGAEDAGLLPWSDGVPNTGTEGSYPGHALMTDSEAEILAAQAAAGFPQNGSDRTQLGQAISRGTWLGTFGGSANALVAVLPNDLAWPALLPGMRFAGTVAQANTGSVTVALGGFAAAPGTLNLLRRDGQPLKSGDLKPGVPFTMVADGSGLRVAVPTASELLDLVTVNPSISPPRNLSSYTTAGTFTFTVPANITWIFVELVGGGGGGHGGGGGVNWSGGGGGSGGYSAGWIPVTPGQAFTVVVGAGASGSDNSADTFANAGGTSAFGASMQATGGGGGRGGPSGSNGGTPGVGTGGQKNFYGANGGDGNPYRNDAQGGNGASSAFGGGGRTATLNNVVMNGVAPGSGGGGIWYSAGAQMGGAGAPGAVIVQY